MTKYKPRKNRKSSYKYIEWYSGCGCSSEFSFKKDCLGYCSVHGESVANTVKIPNLDTTFEEIKNGFEVPK